jgi:hypothetical protein
MAVKSSTSTRALTGIRTLTLQVEPAYMFYSLNPSPSVPSLWANFASYESQWKGVDDKAMAYNESYFDLSGYELDDLTLAIIDAKVQDPGVYTYSGNEDIFICYDIFSQERLTEDDLRLIKSNHTITNMSAPGMSEGPLDRSQIVFGLSRVFARNTTVTGLQTLMLNTRTVRFGSGNPTAVQKLWAYRIVVFLQTPADADKLLIPASTFVLIAQVVQEDDLPYMMRLKRSYELSLRD